MNLSGELTVLFGVLAAYCFWVLRNRPWVYQVLATLCIAGHLVTMGFNGWLAVAKWHGGLPPISLISMVLATTSLLLFLQPARQAATETATRT